MLKSFINAKTGEKVRVIASKEPTKKELEEQLWAEIKWENPFDKEDKKDLSTKKEK